MLRKTLTHTLCIINAFALFSGTPKNALAFGSHIPRNTPIELIETDAGNRTPYEAAQNVADKYAEALRARRELLIRQSVASPEGLAEQIRLAKIFSTCQNDLRCLTTVNTTSKAGKAFFLTAILSTAAVNLASYWNANEHGRTLAFESDFLAATLLVGALAGIGAATIADFVHKATLFDTQLVTDAFFNRLSEHVAVPKRNRLLWLEAQTLPFDFPISLFENPKEHLPGMIHSFNAWRSRMLPVNPVGLGVFEKSSAFPASRETIPSQFQNWGDVTHSLDSKLAIFIHHLRFVSATMSRELPYLKPEFDKFWLRWANIPSTGVSQPDCRTLIRTISESNG